MNMKQFIKPAPFAALIIIGLLVITGCQGLFEPPAAPAADGTGTLFVSINGADGRTILPEAELNKYVLELYTGTDTLYDERELTGSAALSLPAGIYKVVVKGYVNDVEVAQGEEQNVEVIAEQATTVEIDLEPEAAGDGTFFWDFLMIYDLTDLALEIYEVEDDVNVWYGGRPDPAGSILLPAGVYNVKFSVTIYAETYSWWEILYICTGLTSYYDASNVLEEGVIPYIYEVPDAGPGFFYLDLNNWQTQSTGGAYNSGINDTLVTGNVEADKLTVNFTVRNQRLNIKLSASQVALMMASNYITVTIDGIAEPDSNFRFFLGDPSQGGSWNATNSGHLGAFSGIVNDPKGTNFSENKSAATVGYFILEHQEEGVSTEVTINSIRINYY